MALGNEARRRDDGGEDDDVYLLRMRVPAALALITLGHIRDRVDRLARKIVAYEAAHLEAEESESETQAPL